MKITRVRFQTMIQIEGVRGQASYLGIGAECDPAWGGGKVTSLAYDRDSNSLAIRKGGRFERVNPAERGIQHSFDVCLIPWDKVAFACGVDEAPEIAELRTWSSDDVAARLAAERIAPAEQVEHLLKQQAPKADPQPEPDINKPAQPIQKQQGQQRR